MSGIPSQQQQYPKDPTRSYGKQQRQPNSHAPMLNHNVSTPAPNDEGFFATATGKEENMVVVGVLVGLVIVLFCIFLGIVGPPLIHYMRRKIPEDPKKIQRRYETVEGWLISKRVRGHDDTCDRVRNECCDDVEKALKLSDSYDTVETTAEEDASCGNRECPICMEEFQVNEIVSWSPNLSGNCVHVFHHECIKEWLLRHGDCPFCREVFLPVDEKEFENQPQKISIKECSEKRQARSSTTYYCLTDGLVTIQKASGECSEERRKRFKAMTASRLKKNELAALRGGRLECTNGGFGADVAVAVGDSDSEMAESRRPNRSSSIFRPTTSSHGNVGVSNDTQRDEAIIASTSR